MMEEYQSPSIEIVEAVVELGFTGSIQGGMGDPDDMCGGGDIGVEW